METPKTPETLPSGLPMPPLPPLTPADPPLWHRPEEVELCFQAATKGDLEEVKKCAQRLLHEPRPSSELQTPHGCWLTGSLFAAMENKDTQMVQFLLDENVAGGCLPVDVAVRMRAVGVLNLFLERGADLNAPQARNAPPVLGIALARNDREMAEYLLDHGADPNARCAWNYTPMSDAMYFASLELIEYLFSRGADARRGELLQHAIHRNKPDALDLVRLLLERGAPFNEVKYKDEPQIYWEREPFGLGAPLHRAAEWGKTDIVKCLLEKGADPLKLDSRGKIPRFWAEKHGCMETARVLKGAEGGHKHCLL